MQKFLQQLWQKRGLRFLLIGGLCTLVNVILIVAIVNLFYWNTPFWRSLANLIAIAITFIKQNRTKDNLQNSITNIRKKILNPFHLWLVGNPILGNQELAVEVLSKNQCQLQSERGFQSFSLMFRLYRCH